MYLTESELHKFGFKSVGTNVLLSNKASVYNPQDVSIGNNVRIDDFVVLSGKITLGNYVHVACYTSLIGKEEIVLCDFCGLSGRVSVYSSSDDYTGLAMTNPTVPLQYRKVQNKKVTLNKHVLVGTGSVLLPGVEVGEGTSVGALSLVKDNCEPFSVYFGVPAVKIGSRLKRFLKYEKNFT